MLETTAAIIGGGPSGLAAALTLLRYTSHRVVVVERDSYQRPRVGETVSSAIGPLLEYLGAYDCIRESGAIESWKNAAAWGANELVIRDHLFAGRGSGWHLDRCRFDLSMADAVERAGGVVLRNTRIRSANRSGPAWTVKVGGEHNTEILAELVIEATGRTASFARLVGAKRENLDHLVGVVAYFAGLDETATDHGTFVEAEEHGWWYAALLPNALAVVAFMVDASRVRDLRVGNWNGFYDRLGRTQHISDFVAGADPIRELHIHSASSQYLRPVIGAGWVAVGDAAVSFDPLSSLGIGHALNSGIQGARIADTRLAGDEELALAYPKDVAGFVEEFQARRTAIYRAEQRWPQSEFWQSRQALLIRELRT
jgi:flavin-dependent dehydrogenase